MTTSGESRRRHRYGRETWGSRKGSASRNPRQVKVPKCPVCRPLLELSRGAESQQGEKRLTPMY